MGKVLKKSSYYQEFPCTAAHGLESDDCGISVKNLVNTRTSNTEMVGKILSFQLFKPDD
jgi:hypothetical protein